jgi:hypothetical protein
MIEQKHLEYLDALRASGAVNMFGAAPYVASRFDITPGEAKTVLLEWMQTFEARGCPGKTPRSG